MISSEKGPLILKENELIGKEPIDMGLAAARILQDMKGIAVKLYRVSEIAPFTDYYVIATGRSRTHMQALASEVKDKLSLAGLIPEHCEGMEGDDWYLVDFSHIIVHIFSRESREFYKLERLLPAESGVSLPDIFADEL